MEAVDLDLEETQIPPSALGTSSCLAQSDSGLGIRDCNGADDGPVILSRSDITFIEELGQGGFSRVFRGVLYDNCQVAIKEIKPEVLHGRSGAKNEVRILSDIDHPHIVGLWGCVFVASKSIWIVMELCSGGSCHDLLHRHKDVEISWLQKWKMCQDVALAMEFLHTCTPKIVHRDLKSANVLLTKPMGRHELPNLKVADFGLSSYLWGDRVYLQKCVGTLRWRAPELQSGSRYNEKVDVFSYGMVLYEVILRKTPFQGMERHVAQGHVEAGEPPDISGIPKACPDALQIVMLACWTHDPEQRPSFASDIVPAFSRGILPEHIISL